MTYKPISEQLDTSKYKIVDSHAHHGLYHKFDIQGGFEDDLVSQMDRIGVDAMAISPMVGLGLDSRLANDITAEVLKKYPGQFYGMALATGNRPKEILSELTRCFDNLGMSFIKLHPDESSCPMTQKCYDHIYGFAAERKLAILNHDWQSPKRVEELAKKYPQVRFIQAHSGGNWDGHREDDYFRVAREYENVFVDICASPIFYGALEALVEIAGADNIIFGSDAPFLNLAFGVGKVLMADLSCQDKQKIFADNFLGAIAPRNG